MPRLRIALVETYPVSAGEENTALSMAKRESEIARILDQQGFETRCFRTTRSEGSTSLSEDGVRWRFSPVDRDTSSEADRLTRSAHMIDSLRAYSPDVVFVKGVATSLSAAILQLGIPIRVAIIGGAHRTRELARYHLILTETPAQEQYLSSHVNDARMMRLPKYASSEFFLTTRATSPSIDLMAVGRLIPLKNLDLLAGLPPNGYRIVLCGDGPLRADLETAFRASGNGVTFAGQLSTQELAETLGRARLLAHPSRSEGVPRAVVEAMAMGTPPVFLHGVIESPHLDSTNSLSTSPESLCDNLRLLLEDDERIARLSEACRITAQREFSHERLEAAVRDLAEHLCDIGAGTLRSRRTAVDMAYRRLRWSLHDLPGGARLQYARSRKRLARLVRRVRSRQLDVA